MIRKILGAKLPIEEFKADFDNGTVVLEGQAMDQATDARGSRQALSGTGARHPQAVTRPSTRKEEKKPGEDRIPRRASAFVHEQATGLEPATLSLGS